MRRTYTYEEGRNGINATFYDHWRNPTLGWQSVTGLSEEPKIIWDNVQEEEPDEPDTSETFLRVQVRHGDSDMTSFGQDGEGSYMAQGIVTVQLFTPLDNPGLIFHDQLAKVVQRAFRGKTGPGDYCGIIFRRARMNEIGPSGGWFQTNILSDFEYDEEV